MITDSSSGEPLVLLIASMQKKLIKKRNIYCNLKKTQENSEVHRNIFLKDQRFFIEYNVSLSACTCCK